MRIATGAYRTSPICNILSESNTIPLHLRRKKLILNYSIKLLQSPKNEVHPLICKQNYPNTYEKSKSKKPFYLRAINYLKNDKISHTDFTSNSLDNQYLTDAEKNLVIYINDSNSTEIHTSSLNLIKSIQNNRQKKNHTSQTSYTC